MGRYDRHRILHSAASEKFKKEKHKMMEKSMEKVCILIVLFAIVLYIGHILGHW